MAASSPALLASLVAQVKGIMFYDYAVCGACRGERVYVIRRPENRYDCNCLDVRLSRGRSLLGHLEAPVAARLSPVMRDARAVVSG